MHLSKPYMYQFKSLGSQLDYFRDLSLSRSNVRRKTIICTNLICGAEQLFVQKINKRQN